jgi:hypothetical protein
MLVKAESASQGESDRQRRLLKAIRQQQRFQEPFPVHIVAKDFLAPITSVHQEWTNGVRDKWGQSQVLTLLN